MSYWVVFTHAAEKQYDALPALVQSAIDACIAELAESGRVRGEAKVLKYTGIWRARAGDYRIFYGRPDGQGIIRIARVAHRSIVYR